MTAKQQALYALMENEGYSYGLCATALKLFSLNPSAIDDAMLFIDDNHPSEEDFISYMGDLCC